MKYKAILFDMDGVILDSEPIHFAAFQATLQNHSYALSHNDYLAHFAGRTDRDGFIHYFEHLNEAFDLPSIMNEKMNIYLELAKDRITPYPGVVMLIKQLSNSVPLALVTGSLRAEATIALETLGIKDCFLFMICAEDIKTGKPDPEGYLKAQSHIGIDKADCVIVEDSPSGIKAANNAGIDSIGITTTHTADELQGATIVTNELTLNLF